MSYPKNDLLDIITSMFPNNTNNGSGNTKALRYVIYARKSTEGAERQVRSLGDQITECEQLAERQNLNIVQIIQESESAKEPGIRPKFREMINGFEKGKYDGILAWHPDRLARNMKDAGEVIDLLDKTIISDLKFVSFTFENNTMGKMLLGMAFVLSKQYSDQLSDNVRRGNRHSIESGQWLNAPKHGYTKDALKRLIPDGENFTILKEGFMMRLRENQPLNAIADHINNREYKRTREGRPQIHKMTKQMLSTIFKDPFYAGVAVYGDKIWKIEEHDPNFVPMIGEEDYKKINLGLLKNTQNKRLSRAFKSQRNIKADLMRGMVLCGSCNKPMVAGITSKINKKTGDKQKYFYYRCDTYACTQKGVSLRAKVVVDFVLDFIKTHNFSDNRIYEHYKKEFSKTIETLNKERTSKIKSQQQIVIQNEKTIEAIKELLLSNRDDKKLVASYSANLSEAERQVEEAQKSMVILKEEMNVDKNVPISYEKFVELFNNLAEYTKKVGDMSELDSIIRKIFLNFTIQDQKIATYTINSPFREFIELGFVSLCRGDRT